MVYTFIKERSIRLLSLSKTMLGQYHTASFAKNHTIDLLKDGTIENVDLVASAIKEGLTQAQPSPITDKEIFLILPQESFIFARYAIPGDISDAAILSFVKDKLRADIGVDTETMLHDFIVTKTDEGCVVLFYGMDKDKFAHFDDAFRLLGLTVANVIPETLAYFKLFNKTLNQEKQEKVMYVNYDEEDSFGFVYDALGLMQKERIVLKDEIVESLKKEVEELQTKQQLTLNRIILSGPKSKDIRQDFFTKDVGVWTNPLEKIIQNFYSEYVKLLIPTEGTQFAPLQFSVNLGAFIFDCEKDQFQPLSPNRKIKVTQSGDSKRNISLPASPFGKRDIGIFLLSFIISFGIILGASQLKNIPKIKQTKNTLITTKPTLSKSKITPTPSLSRDEIKIKILNGTGIKGKANEYATILKEEKYSEVLTGNADSFDIENTEIQVKKNKKDAVSLIKTDLKGLLSITRSSTLNEDEAADVVIILGLDSVSPTPTSAAKASPTKAQ